MAKDKSPKRSEQSRGAVRPVHAAPAPLRSDALPDAPIVAVFFDLGDTLGTPRFEGSPPRLAGFDIFPFVPNVLKTLRGRGLRLGIISNTGDEPGSEVDKYLESAGVLHFFDKDLRIYSKDVGKTKAEPGIFVDAANAGAVDVNACLFVGEDARERAVAGQAGMRVCPHPLLVEEVLAGQQLQFVRATAPAGASISSFLGALRDASLVPLHRSGANGSTVYGIASGRKIAQLINMRLSVMLLGQRDGPLFDELYLLRDDLARETGFTATGQSEALFATPRNASLAVSATGEGIVVALPPDRSLGEFHFHHTRHGHTLKLLPDPSILEPLTHTPAFATAFVSSEAADRGLTPAESDAFSRISASDMQDRINRYSGEADVIGTVTRIKSRHINHPHNQPATDLFAADLQQIGQGKLRVSRQRFTHRGRALENLEAELTGLSPELVLVTAHLDSTGAQSPHYDEVHDDAPGADDDGSGVAAVMAIAQRFIELSRSSPPQRTIRFVLFNAEEEGLVGSRVYARQQRAAGAPIVAVFQMDMISYNKVPPTDWEVHAGFAPSRDVEDRSMALAKLIHRVAPVVSPGLQPPELFQTGGNPDGDPAAGRSDHASFQEVGYAACVASEDFFVQPGSTTQPDENPNYHTTLDKAQQIDPVFAADIARAVAAAAWLTATVQPAGGSNSFMKERPMPIQREFDSRLDTRSSVPRPADTAIRSFAAPGAAAPGAMTAPARSTGAARTNRFTGTPAVVTLQKPAASQPMAFAAELAAFQPPDGPTLVDKALSFVARQRTAFGFAAGDVAEFSPDPIVQRTSAGSASVHLHQFYRGIPVFQMVRTVRFNPQSEPVDAAGDNAVIPAGLKIEPTMDAAKAVLAAAKHLATTGVGTKFTDKYGQEYALPTVDIEGFEPRALTAFPLPTRPTVFDKGPFEEIIPANLVIFYQPDSARLAWYTVLTFPRHEDEYVVIVSADDQQGQILFSKSNVQKMQGRGNVFEYSPGVGPRRMIDFPRALSDFPAMPTAPLAGFPPGWVDDTQTVGNSAEAILNLSGGTLAGINQSGAVVFNPEQPDGDDQKLLNIFYFCNYMHDFLYILGFDEAAGNFQRVNFTHTGLGGDPVKAHAHSGRVSGTANMLTKPDGISPVMNMGLVQGKLHTAFDADVVFHEYTHGLTNRLVGGRMNTNALDALQSRGMGEGWSDFFALTIQNYFKTIEKVVTGDWVIGNKNGIRSAPYDDNFPITYGQLKNLRTDPQTGEYDEHDIGELWCAILMMMARRIRRALSDDHQGYRLSWQIVVDGLKLTPSNPTFIDARDAILRALDDLKSQNRLQPVAYRAARRAAWEAFAHFGVGANASSADTDVSGISEDKSLPSDL